VKSKGKSPRNLINQMITTTNKEELKKFLDAFTNDPCSNVQLKEDQKEKYQDFVRELHDDEMPNNWRYQIIFDLLHNFVNEYDQDDLEGYLHEIADSLVDVYNTDRAKWLADDINRGCIEIDTKNKTSIFELIGIAQYEAIYSMGFEILHHHY
tara:strand:+ start:74 stop:532 length:459 start_codon:yes stop_codon:yes gene_type:complete